MKEMQFKTNIMCGNCLAKVKPSLGEVLKEGSWEIDLKHPDRVLKVSSSLSPSVIREAIEEAGFSAEELD